MGGPGRGRCPDGRGLFVVPVVVLLDSAGDLLVVSGDDLLIVSGDKQLDIGSSGAGHQLLHR
jgi:hypothetical protein